MNRNVKTFIEHNIELIEEHNWTALFDQWYTKYHMFDRSVDLLMLRELFDVLQEIGILPNEHRAAREELIAKYFNEYIDDKIFENEKIITAGGAINALHSYLGLSLLELKSKFIDICTQRGFKVDSDNTKVSLT